MKKEFFAAALFLLAFCFLAFGKEVPKVNKTLPFHKGISVNNWLEDFGCGNFKKNDYDKSDFENIKSLGVDFVRV